jgi:hypothetical protein
MVRAGAPTGSPPDLGRELLRYPQGQYQWSDFDGGEEGSPGSLQLSAEVVSQGAIAVGVDASWPSCHRPFPGRATEWVRECIGSILGAAAPPPRGQEKKHNRRQKK